MPKKRLRPKMYRKHVFLGMSVPCSHMEPHIPGLQGSSTPQRAHDAAENAPMTNWAAGCQSLGVSESIPSTMEGWGSRYIMDAKILSYLQGCCYNMGFYMCFQYNKISRQWYVISTDIYIYRYTTISIRIYSYAYRYSQDHVMIYHSKASFLFQVCFVMSLHPKVLFLANQGESCNFTLLLS